MNVRECRERSGPLLVAFLVAAAGTVLASVVAIGVLPVVPRLLERSLGLDGLKIAAALMAKNVGGGIVSLIFKIVFVIYNCVCSNRIFTK